MSNTYNHTWSLGSVDNGYVAGKETEAKAMPNLTQVPKVGFRLGKKT